MRQTKRLQDNLSHHIKGQHGFVMVHRCIEA